MSYSAEVKNELAKLKTDDCDLDAAELYGFIFGGAALVFFGRGDFGLRISSGLASSASRVYTLIKNLYVWQPEIRHAEKRSFGGRREYTVTVADTATTAAVLRDYELMDETGTPHTASAVNLSLLHGSREDHAFLRGVFLSCGTLSDPLKSFSLEFHFSGAEAASSFCAYLGESGAEAKTRSLKNDIIVYVRNAETIASLLAMCGSHRCALDMQDRSAMREMKNRMNRLVNFETANLNKTVDSSRAQVEAIEKITAGPGLSVLPGHLLAAAQLRLDNPEAPLSELAARAGISRSTLYKRMQKLINIAKGIK